MRRMGPLAFSKDPQIMAKLGTFKRPDPNPQTLREVAQEAFTKNPGNCSGAVYYVITHLVDSQAQYHQANELMQIVSIPGSGWKQVNSMEEAVQLADQGIVVIAGLADIEAGHFGHVVVVLPGGKIPSINRKEISAPVMSTSLSNYPGAISNGDKTVYDVWGRKKIQMVTYWTPEQP
jgi:hypothetical protein